MMTGTDVGGIIPTSEMSIEMYSGGVRSYCMLTMLRLSFDFQSCGRTT